ncbi:MULTISPECIES: HAD family hydrolase [unclassified Spirillospora]|uniref:HAD family hydrolase n=1 Tax=unclassified Spirillospora TaxID=2642701 RepID=UPI0037203E26
MTPAILFGLTGVLVDDTALHRRAAHQTASEAGFSLTAEDHRTFFAGRTAHEGFRAFLTHRTPNRLGEIDDILAAKARSYRALAETDLHPYPGAVELVMALCGTRHQLALVTDSTIPEVAAALRVLRLDDAFDAIVTAESVPEGKPSSARYLAAARMLNRPPQHCLVIERGPTSTPLVEVGRPPLGGAV